MELGRPGVVSVWSWIVKSLANPHGSVGVGLHVRILPALSAYGFGSTMRGVPAVDAPKCGAGVVSVWSRYPRAGVRSQAESAAILHARIFPALHLDRPSGEA